MSQKKVEVAVIIYYQFMMPQSLALQYEVKSPVLGLQWAPSVQVLYAQTDIISQWKMGT